MRGKQAVKRKIKPDAKYSSMNIAKFINYIMKDGKKSVAGSIVYNALDIVKALSKKEPTEIFEKALKNVTPVLEVKTRRIGGANYQIPIQVRGDRRNALAFRWIIQAAKSRKGMPMKDRLAKEFIDASKEEGAAVAKRQDVQRMAESNRAFAHFAR